MKYVFTVATLLLIAIVQLQAWNTPSISSPAEAAQTWAGVTLNWNAVSNSQGYQLQVDTSIAFNSPLLFNKYEGYINSSGSNSDTDEFITGLLFGVTHYWRVRAYVSGDTSAWNTQSFITRDYVTLSSPASGADAWSGVNLNWAVHTGISQYQWQADTSALFSSPAFQTGNNGYINSTDGNSDTEHYLANTYFGKTYYWRVRAINAVDTSNWSEVRTINIRDYVTLSSPASGADAWSGVTLNWAVHTGISQYQWQADTSASFNSPAFQTGNNGYINSTDGNSDTEHYLANTYFGKTYYWRVRAINAVDTSSWSEVRTINIRDYVTLSSPTSGADAWSGVTLNWAVHTGISQYQWQADTSASFSSPAFQTSNNGYINSTDGNSDTEHFLTNTYFGKTYYWRVSAINAVDTSNWSEVRTINIRDYVTLSSPASGADAWSGVTLNWAVHTGISQYQWQADTSALFSSPAFQTGNNGYINSTDGNSDTEHFLTNIYFGKTYYWRVRAINAVDTSSWSEVRTINIRDYVTLSSPASGADAWSGVNLNWAVHTGISQYQWQADTSALFSSPAFQTSNNGYINSTDGNSDTEHFLTNTYFGKTYYWRVRAINAVDTSIWSEVRSVNIRNYVTMTSPSNGATNRSVSGVTLDWAVHTGIAYYQLQFDSTGLFNSPFLQSFNKSYINSTNGNSDTQQSSGPLAANTIYFWRVRVVNAVDTSAWSTWAFSTGSAPIVYPEVPLLLSPADGSDVSQSGEDLKWYSVSGVTGYQYEYDASPNFASPISGVVADTSANTGILQSKTDYFWRVRSVNGNIPSEWSQVWGFSTAIKISGAVLTQTGVPVPGATVVLSGQSSASVITLANGLYSFVVDSGGNYNVSVSKNNDVIASNGISTLDIVLIKQFILDQQGLSTPYKLIAADVNESGSISTLDILFLRAIILGNTSTFPNGRLWRFVPSDYLFADPTNPFTFPGNIIYINVSGSISNQNFIGIKLGDVSNNWDPNTP